MRASSSVKHELESDSRDRPQRYDMQSIMAEKEAMQQELARLRWAAERMPQAGDRHYGDAAGRDHSGVSDVVTVTSFMCSC